MEKAIVYSCVLRNNANTGSEWRRTSIQESGQEGEIEKRTGEGSWIPTGQFWTEFLNEQGAGGF